MSIRKLCFPLSLCSSGFILSFFMALIFIKSKNYIIWRMSLNLGCLSLWIRHNTGVKLTCISVGKNGLGERMTWVVPLWMTFSLVPFIKLYFFDRFLLNFFLFYFSFCISQEICARGLWSCEHLAIQQLSPSDASPSQADEMRCAQSSVAIDSLGYFSSQCPSPLCHVISVWTLNIALGKL